MLKLITNELIKMLKKKSTIIVMVIMLLMCFGVQLIIKFSVNVDSYFTFEEEIDNMTLEEYKKEYLSGVNENDTSEFNWDVVYVRELEKIGVEYMSDSRCDKVVQVISCFIDEDGNIDVDAVDRMVDELVARNFEYQATLEMLAKNADVEYTKEVLNDAITNRYQYLIDKGVTSEDDWRVEKVELIAGLQDSLESASEKSAEYREALKQYKVWRYTVDNNIESYVSDDTKDNLYGDLTEDEKFWVILLNSTAVLTILSICMVVLAGQIVAGEYSGGTIKFLLMNPVSRGKIIASKYLTIIFMSLVLTTVSFVLNLIVAVIINGGAHSLGMSYIAYNGGKLVKYSAVLFYLKHYMLKFVEVVIYETMAFAISSLFRSTAAAVGIGIAGMMCGSVISSMLAAFNQDWGRYLIFSNSNLSSVISGTVNYPGMTLTFSVCVIIVHMVVFLLVAHDGFVRREV